MAALSAMKRLVCIVEGQGDAQALPNLCTRIRDYLKVTDWFVDDEPIRRKRSELVDEREASPFRAARKEQLEKALHMARARPADAVLVVCDADDDCAVTWAKSATEVIRAGWVGAAVMAIREYEAWLLASKLNAAELEGRSIESLRDAKTPLRAFQPDYKPSVHQLKLTRTINVADLRPHSKSFDKLVRTLAALFRVQAPSITRQATPPAARSRKRR